MIDLGLNKKLAMTDKYKLPEPTYFTWTQQYYTEAQMQQAFQAGIEAARGDLTIAYMSGYHKGRDSMKAEAVKVCNSNKDFAAAEAIRRLK